MKKEYEQYIGELSASTSHRLPLTHVRLWVNETLKMHSTVKSRTRHPVWNEDFRLTVHDYEHQALRFIVYDSDAFRRDD